MDGVGFAVDAQHGILMVDFDACIADGHLHPEVAAVCATSYCEISPSGTGVRLILRGQLGNGKDHAKPGGPSFGIELFSTKGFCTFTGNVHPLCDVVGNENTIAAIAEPLMQLVQSRFRRAPTEPPSGGENTEPVGLSTAQILTALASLDPDIGHSDWLMVGMALHAETSGEGFELWNEWSSYGTKYPGADALRERWNSFGRNSGEIVTARSLVRLANEHGADIDIHAPASAADFDAISDEAPDDDDSGFDIVGPASAKPTAKPARFQPVSVALFAQRAAPSWIVKGVIPRAELVVLFGESGSGKSFAALDLAACIAREQPWRGRRTRKGRVVYIAAEGAGGFRNRCVAYAQAHDLRLADLPLDIIDAAPNFLLKDDALDVARAIGRADLVIVDTWAQVTPGGNENAGEDMGKALAHCKGIHRATGATVLLVHHSGKDASKGARGWSGLRAAADAELEVVRLATGRLLRTSKQKDGDDGLEWGFGLDVVEIGVDEDGDAITSCVVVEQEVPTAKILRTLGPKEAIVNDVLQEMALAQTTGLEVTAIITASVAKMAPPEAGKRDTRKQHARRALESLCAGDDAPYWLRDDGTVDVV